MRIVVVSDTHGRHNEIEDLEGEVLVHCGDFCDESGEEDLEGVDAWFARQRFELILCTGGNHDFAAEKRIHDDKPVLRNAVWLQDTRHVFKGLNFYGAPWVPHLEGWAFYRTSAELREKWAMIPDDTDILVTHTPPFGILDRPRSLRTKLGCEDLRDRVDVVEPRLHLFGHVHASAGVWKGRSTTFVNASMVDSTRDTVGSPVIVDCG